MESPAATGIILAGGYSERFGPGNKALAKYQNRPLIHHVTKALLDVTPTVIINCRDDQQPAYADALHEFEASIRFALDPTPDAGPLVGLETAIEHCTTETVIVLACDMPLVDSGLLEYLLRSLATFDAVIPRTDDNTLHPTHAAYRVDRLDHAITQTKEDGKDRLLDLCDYLDYTTLSQDQIEALSTLSTLTSIDTKRDLTRLQSTT